MKIIEDVSMPCEHEWLTGRLGTVKAYSTANRWIQAFGRDKEGNKLWIATEGEPYDSTEVAMAILRTPPSRN